MGTAIAVPVVFKINIKIKKSTFHKNLCIIKVENESHESGCRRNR